MLYVIQDYNLVDKMLEMFNLNVCLLVFFFRLTFTLERNKKRDIRNWYQSANDHYNDAIEEKPRDTLRRGDIPILHGDCDG